jgi:hypothetical protein
VSSPSTLPGSPPSQYPPIYHPLINGRSTHDIVFNFYQLTDFSGRPCDEEGSFLPPNTPPRRHRRHDSDPDDWTPYQSRPEFELANFLYSRAKMSPSSIDTLLGLLAATSNIAPPFADHSDLYDIIDSTPLGHVPWQHSFLQYEGDVPDGDFPQWVSSEHQVWFRDPRLVVENMIGNPDFRNDFDITPVRIFDRRGSREYQNFMSGDWAWEEAVCFYDVHSLLISLTFT